MMKILSVRYLSLVCMAMSIIVPCIYLLESVIQARLYWVIIATSYLVYGLFFYFSSKETEDKTLKIGGYISSASILYFLFVFYGELSYYDNSICYPIKDYLGMVSFVAAFGLLAFHFILLQRSGWTMWRICASAMFGLFLIGVQFINWKLHYTFSYSAAIFIPYTLLAFSFYQLYKKL